MYIASTQVRVRYAETDQMAYVYYGNYAMYYEVGRVEALRQLGFEYAKLEEQGVMMPVLDLQCKFISPARYDELLTVTVTIPEIPTARMLFEYSITNESGKVVNKGSTTLVFIDMETNRPCRAPEELLKTLKPHFE
ncbi:acyl-CoA thioester hydrolase [Roseivirga pacifica]|uniref:Acyl-CoA thioester hydrolase n=1 Tax=Roseivirga pacifica TaxID=1267423 RepID=A0A1I0M6D9_9BACT|nr:thioesterase family protein [Roseivirga pacifica]RKQ50081.1 acyl-CoA thioester hydrolase [Roseivirga pacifica]SEV83514.1 acyl-CoA thioester hydrolase [Roseivirga pacifica]